MYSPKFILIIVLFTLLGCKKETCDQNIPSITLNSADRNTNGTQIKIQVRDCDGDIGLEDADTAGAFRFNAFVDVRPFINGEWSEKLAHFLDSTVVTRTNSNGQLVPVDTLYDTLNFYYRIPAIDSRSRSTIYDAEVELNLTTSDFGYDTFRLEISIKDKALNRSNTVSTNRMIR